MIRSLSLAIAITATVTSAQATAQSNSPPVRTVMTVSVSDSTTLAAVASVRSLPNGGVIVNEVGKRQLVVFDSALAHRTVIADTSTRPEYSYGLRAKNGGLVPYVADSTMFADNETSILLVINPVGAIVNVIAPVRSTDLDKIVSGAYGTSGFDRKGRLVYGSIRQFDLFKNKPGPGDPPLVVSLPDSAPLLRADFDERSVDTLVMIKVATQKTVLTSSETGGISTRTAFNPLPSGDDWTMLPDGTIAIVRAQDYHIDWLSPDGKLTSSPKMPFDWKAISSEEKKQMVDSVKRGLDEASAKDFAANPPTPGTAPTVRLNFTVDAADIPDFYPPIRQNTTRADLNGRVWILPSTSAGARNGLLYDVVNRQGEIVERVQLPLGRALVGFGKGDIVYLSNVRGANSAVLERAQIMR